MTSRFSAINIMGLMLCLVPFALLTGPFIPDFFISIIALSFLFISIKNKLWNYYDNKFFYFFITFYIYFLIVSLVSENIIYSLEAVIFYFRFIIFSLAVWFLLNNDTNLINKFTKFLYCTFIIAIIDGYYQFIFGESIFGFIAIADDRMTLTFNNKMILGGYLSRMLPFLIALSIITHKKSKTYAALNLALIIAVCTLIPLTGERTAIGILVLFLLFSIIFIRSIRHLSFKVMILSVILFSIVVRLSPSIKERLYYFTDKQMHIGSSIKNNYIPLYFSINHQNFAHTGLNIYLDNKITGVGPDAFRLYCDDIRYKSTEKYITCSSHPHNLYIQLASETGTFGIFFLLVPLFYFFINIISNQIKIFFNKKLLYDDYQLCMIICFLITLFPFLPTLNLFNNWKSIIYFLPCGFFMYSLNNNN